MLSLAVYDRHQRFFTTFEELKQLKLYSLVVNGYVDSVSCVWDAIHTR